MTGLAISSDVQTAEDATFSYRLDRNKMRQTRLREGRSLLRTNLVEEDPTKPWSHYLLLNKSIHLRASSHRHPYDRSADALSRGRLLGCAGDRQMPAATNGHEPEPKTEESAGNRHRGRGEPQRGTDHDHGRAGQSGDVGDQ